MFEQKVVFNTGRKRYTFPLAVGIMAALMALLAFMPAKAAVKLRKEKEKLVYTPLPKTPEHVKIVKVERGGGRSSGPSLPQENPAPRKPGRPFEAPSRIPPQVVVIDDGGKEPEIAVGHGDGIAKTPQVGECPLAICSGSGTGTVATAPPPAPKPVEKPATPQRIRVGGNVQSAKLIKQPKPLYPPLAKVGRIQGVVRLTAIIGKDGSIQQLQLVSGQPLLVQAAMEAVRQWIYQPTLLNGEPVEVVTQIDVNFTLSN